MEYAVFDRDFPDSPWVCWNNKKADVSRRAFLANERYRFSVSEDWFFGHAARQLGSRIKMCSAVFVETETPSAILFSSGGARGGFADAFGVDALRYFLLREVSFGNDGSYSAEAIVTRVNAELANAFGNLAQRTLSFIAKNLERIGDHATNVAEMVYYAATGDRMAERARGGRKGSS